MLHGEASPAGRVLRGRRTLLATVSLSALGALAAVVVLGSRRGGPRELLSGDANDLWATTPGSSAVNGVSVVAGALNVFRNIAAGSPVPTTCWEPPCAPSTVSVKAAAIPHRLQGILTGVKMLENRLKDFEEGEAGWQQSVQGFERRDAKVLRENRDKETDVYRDEGDVRRFLSTPGPPGAPGPMGFRGITGAPGKMGWQGLLGEIGREGDPGNRGHPGAPGPSGISGAPGPTGMQGPLGDEGQVGLEGPVGDDGLQGNRGEQGPPGDDGLLGEDGTTLVGLPGPPGPRGRAGPMGIMGASGVEGSSGLEGHIGIPGGNGIPGVAGHYGGPFGNGRAIAAAFSGQGKKGGKKGKKGGKRKGGGQGKRGKRQMKRLMQLAKMVKKEERRRNRGKSTHACAGGRVKNKRIGNTGFFLGCNNIEEGAKIIIYGDNSKYTVGPGDILAPPEGLPVST